MRQKRRGVINECWCAMHAAMKPLVIHNYHATSRTWLVQACQHDSLSHRHLQAIDYAFTFTHTDQCLVHLTNNDLSHSEYDRNGRHCIN